MGHSFESRQPLAVGVRTRADPVERDGLEAEPPRRRILRQPETVRRQGDLLRIHRHKVVPHFEHFGLAMPADILRNHAHSLCAYLFTDGKRSRLGCTGRRPRRPDRAKFENGAFIRSGPSGVGFRGHIYHSLRPCAINLQLSTSLRNNPLVAGSQICILLSVDESAPNRRSRSICPRWPKFPV